MLKTRFVLLVSRVSRRLKPCLLASKNQNSPQTLVDIQKMQPESEFPAPLADQDYGLDNPTTPSLIEDEGCCQSRSKSLGELPSEVLLEIFFHLECMDVISLSQVSHLFHEISKSITVWQSLAFNLMCRSRRISLHNYLTINSLTASQLRQSVLITTFAERSWLDPRNVASAKVKSSTWPTNVDLEQGSYVMKFTSDHHLVLPTVDIEGGLIGWNTLTNTQAGSYAMDAGEILINVQPVYASRSLYWITGKALLDNENDQGLSLRIIRVQFPEPTSLEAVVSFEVLGELKTTWTLANELHFIDASRRMICAVFENIETGCMSLHVILDWKSGLSYVFDTGIPYDYGRSVIGLHLSDDGRAIILHSERFGVESRRSYLLEPMYASATVWSLDRYTQFFNPIFDLGMEMSFVTPNSSAPAHQSLNNSGSLIPYIPAHIESKFTWTHDRAIFRNQSMTPHTVWALPQWWPTYEGVPKRSCTIILHHGLSPSEDGQIKRVFKATQHYSECTPTGDGITVEKEKFKECIESGLFYGYDTYDDQDYFVENNREERVLGGAPCSPVRSVIEITNPVLQRVRNVDQTPILAQSFNHLCWIEEHIVYEDGPSYHGRWRSTLGRRKSGPRPCGGRNWRDEGAFMTSLIGRFNPRNWLSRYRGLRDGSGRGEYGRKIGRRVRSLKLVTFPDPGMWPIGSAHPCQVAHSGRDSNFSPVDHRCADSSTYVGNGSSSLSDRTESSYVYIPEMGPHEELLVPYPYGDSINMDYGEDAGYEAGASLFSRMAHGEPPADVSVASAFSTGDHDYGIEQENNDNNMIFNHNTISLYENDVDPNETSHDTRPDIAIMFDHENDYEYKQNRSHSWDPEENRRGKQERQGVREDECTCTTLRPVTLDVPMKILDAANYMFLDEGAGTVTVVTKDNIMYEYQYGRSHSA